MVLELRISRPGQLLGRQPPTPQPHRPLTARPPAQETSHAAGDGAQPHERDSAHHTPSGITRWVYSTNLKDTGALYMVSATSAAFSRASFSVVMRLELME